MCAEIGRNGFPLFIFKNKKNVIILSIALFPNAPNKLYLFLFLVELEFKFRHF